MKSAVSYIRFSSPEQAKGDSFRRQSEAAAAWAKSNGYEIKQSLEDLGVSAYRGRNEQAGDFADFLAAAEAGELPKDSVLIVENLDRVSRQAPRKALTTFLRLINAGVGIMTLTDGTLHTAESLDKDPIGMGLFGALMVMVRANGESRLKGERVAAAWSKKRKKAREAAVPMTDRIPNWLDSKRDAAGRRTFSENKHANTVRRIFAETVQGLGRRMIAKGLNRGEGTPTFLSGNGWQISTIGKILAGRTVLGEYQPCRRDETGKLVPDGPPILNYYPAVVDETLWEQANAAIGLRRRNGGGRPQRRGLNLIPGLGWCVCGERMAFLNKGDPPKGGQYHACSAAQRGAECTNTRLWSAKAVERYLIHQIEPTQLDEVIEPVEVSGPPARNFEAEIADLEAKRKGAIASILRNPDNALGAEMERVANSLANEIAEVHRQRDAAVTEERSRPHLPTVRAALQDVASLVAELNGASVEDRLALRMRLTQQIRTAFAEIQFGPHTIFGLIALPGMPKSMTGAFGMPRAFIPKPMKDGTQRWFYRHTIFSDEPLVVEELDGGTGLLGARRPRAGTIT
jgi:DNA invertase Pin-like site-specific DNA recombinase